MKPFLSRLAVLIVAALLAVGVAHAESELGYKSYTKMGKFEDVLFELQNAIINRGYVIDYAGHLQTMLERTSEAVGSVTPEGRKTPYLHAEFLQFCSAKLTHEVVSANPLNIAICPYVVFAFELNTEPGKIHVGYRRPIAGPSKLTRAAVAKVEKLLDDVVRDAVK